MQCEGDQNIKINKSLVHLYWNQNIKIFVKTELN